VETVPLPAEDCSGREGLAMMVLFQIRFISPLDFLSLSSSTSFLYFNHSNLVVRGQVHTLVRVVLTKL